MYTIYSTQRKLLLIMKITTLLLITTILQASATTALAQKVTLNEKNAPLVQVFNDINQQTGYDFAFTTTTLQNAKPVTIDVKNEDLSDVLTKIFANEPLDFSIENKSVVVQPKIATLYNQARSNLAQVTVTGKVTNELGEPMVGVTVKEKGTNNAVATDTKGNYTLNVTDEKTIVSFTYIGYETQELKAGDIPSGSVIILKPQPQNLQEVVINKGYYDEKRELSVGDESIVDAKTIEEQPVADPIQALIGRVPGLNIQQTSGIPGSYATIQIRGQNSIAGGNDPLYVIDGVPFSSQTLSSQSMSDGAFGGSPGSYNSNGAGVSPFSALNLYDIENIEVLKDADATAIYGSRGANGAILITTKKGKAGATKFTLDANQGAGSVAHFMDMLNTQQYLQVRRLAFTNDGLSFPSIKNNPYDGNYDVDGVWDTTRNTNWQKALIGGTATWTNINGDLSGGNTNTQFLIGGGYNHQSTVYPGDYGDTKGSVHVSITNTSDNQRFKAQFTASYVNDNNYVPVNDYTNAALMLPPDAPALYNPNGSLNWQIYNGSSTFSNPLASMFNSQTSVTNNMVSNIGLSYLLLPGLTLKSNFGYTHDEMNETEIQTAASFAPPNNTNPGARSITFANTVFQTWIIEPQLTYNRKIAKGNFDALVGATFQENQQKSITEYAQGFASDALITDPAAASYTGLEGDNSALYKYNAIYGRIGYNWEEKYLLNITARRDGSSRFGPDKQFGNFGAIGAGWIFSKEKFSEDNLPWLSFGKLRGSYGLTGNDQIGDYQYLSSYTVNSTSYQGLPQLLPARLPNPDFSWETDKKLEGGLELGFLKDRISLSLSYYRNRSGNQLVGYPLPYLSGFTSYQYNLPATVQNTGLEAELHTVNIKEMDFNWTTSINFTFPHNKLISFPGIDGTSYVQVLEIGQPITNHKVWNYIGVNPQTGQYAFATQNADGVLGLNDYVNVNPTQKFYGGMQNSFTYKNFNLDIFLQFVSQIGFNYQEYFAYPGTESNLPATVLSGVWQSPGQVSTIEKYSTQYPNQNSEYQNSNGVFTNASFIKLKNVSLSYKLPVAWQTWAGMQNARFYIQGENLYTFTKYIGLDPETQGLGLPPLRTITAGISASF